MLVDSAKLGNIVPNLSNKALKRHLRSFSYRRNNKALKKICQKMCQNLNMGDIICRFTHFFSRFFVLSVILFGLVLKLTETFDGKKFAGFVSTKFIDVNVLRNFFCLRFTGNSRNSLSFIV